MIALTHYQPSSPDPPSGDLPAGVKSVRVGLLTTTKVVRDPAPHGPLETTLPGLKPVSGRPELPGNFLGLQLMRELINPELESFLQAGPLFENP